MTQTWLEEQPDEVQLLVLSMADERLSYKAQCLQLWKRFQLCVEPGRLKQSLASYRETHAKELLQARLYARRLVELVGRHPEIDLERLSRGFFLTQMASPEFLQTPMAPKDLLSALHREQKLVLDARRVRAIERANRIRADRVKLARERQELIRRRLEGALANEQADPEQFRRQVREIFGLLDEAPQRSTAAPLSTEVGAG